MLRFLFLLLVLTVTAVGQVKLGASKQEVIDLFGWPTSVSRSTGKEILNYPDFTMFLEEDRLTSFQMKPGNRKPLSSYLLTPPAAAPVKAAPAPVRPLVPAPTVARPTSVMPSPVRETPGPEQGPVPAPLPTDPNAALRWRLTAMVVGFGVILALKLWSGDTRRGRKRAKDQLYRPSAPPPPTPLRPSVFSATTSTAQKPASAPHPLGDGWSLSLLREIEWHRFEQVVAAYERELGHEAVLTDFGPDGGIDVHVYENGSRTLKRVVQCKAHRAPIGVDLIRAFYGTMTVAKAPHGAFYTTGSFSSPVIAEAKSMQNLELVDGPTFLDRIRQLQLSAQLRLFSVATEGEYTTPTCPSCGTKMRLKTSGKGRNEGDDFWGCRNFPSCQRTLNVRRTD